MSPLLQPRLESTDSEYFYSLNKGGGRSSELMTTAFSINNKRKRPTKETASVRQENFKGIRGAHHCDVS